MVEVGRLVDQLPFPLNVAAGMEARGLPTGVPKMIVSPESHLLYQKIVGEARSYFHANGLAPA